MRYAFIYRHYACTKSNSLNNIQQWIKNSIEIEKEDKNISWDNVEVSEM